MSKTSSPWSLYLKAYVPQVSGSGLPKQPRVVVVVAVMVVVVMEVAVMEVAVVEVAVEVGATQLLHHTGQ